METSSPETLLGFLLAEKWAVEKILGAGGMATVYAARHRNGHRVAVKVLRPELTSDAELVERFAREGYVANCIEHEGVVQVIDDGVLPDGSPYLVMELLSGETLEARLHRRGALPTDEVLVIAEQLLEVLVAAHAAGVVHRDLKPDNLFLTKSGKLKVLDFGIARLSELVQSGASMTRKGTILGTPPFMAPEQARGRWDEVDGRTDIYAIGATLFTLLTGQYVHPGETVNEQLVAAGSARAPSIRSRAEQVPEAAAEIVDRALSYEPERRYQTAEEMLNAIRAVIGLELPVSYRLPIPSVRGVDSSVLTVRASSEPQTALPALSPGQTVGEGGALTRSNHEPPKASPRRLWVGVGAAALVVVALAAVGLTQASFSSSAATAAVQAPTASLEAAAAPASEVAAPEEVEPEATPVEAEVAEAAPDAGAADEPEAEGAPSAKPAKVAKPPVRRPKPRPVQVSDDLYDRRY